MNSIVTNEDCMIGMARYPDKYFELAIVDPPYGIGFDRESKSMCMGLRKDGTVHKQSAWRNRRAKGYLTKEWDVRPVGDYWSELLRVSKNQIIWGGNYFTDYLKPSGGWVAWIKGVPDGMSLSQAELAWCSGTNSIRVVEILWAGYKKADNETRLHPTQKPVTLYTWLLKNYAKQGDKILDTHLGSGSSRIAAYKAGFDFTGFELDKDYFEAQEKRFKTFTDQTTLL